MCMTNCARVRVHVCVCVGGVLISRWVNKANRACKSLPQKQKQKQKSAKCLICLWIIGKMAVEFVAQVKRFRAACENNGCYVR